MNSPHSVLLIDTPFAGKIREPLGLAYVASSLRHRGVSVAIACDTERVRLTADSVVERAAGHGIVGISATTPSFDQALAFARRLKQERPEVFVVLGGYHGTMLHETILDRHPEFDAVVRGEAEESFPEFLLGFEGSLPPATPVAGVSHRREGSVLVGPSRKPVADLDSLPTPAWDLLPPAEDFPRLYDTAKRRMLKAFSLSSSRGCPFRCAFCSIIRFYGESRVRYRSPANVVKDIALLADRYGVECIHFCDDTFLTSPSRLEEILRGGFDLGLGLSFRFNARPDQVLRARGLLPSLAAWGVMEIELGIENGAQSALDRYGKGLRVEHSIEALQALKQAGIRVHVDYIPFDPWTTVDELLQNVGFLKQHLPWGYPTHHLVFKKLQLYPGTELYDAVIASGRYTGDPKKYPDFVFQDPFVASIWEFLEGCAVEAAPDLTAADAAGHRVMESMPEGAADRTRFLGEYVFAQAPLSRLPLNLLDRAVTARHNAGARAVPETELDAIKKKFLADVKSLSRQLESLRDRIQAHGPGGQGGPPPAV